MFFVRSMYVMSSNKTCYESDADVLWVSINRVFMVQRA